MADLYASLNGEQITSARITIPAFGAWHGDVTLALPNAIAGDVTITIGDLTLIGHSYRMASFAGARGLRVVGGHGGWQQQVAPQAYETPSGVLASTVLGDAATAVQETLVLANDIVLGSAFVRERCVASRVLRQIVGDTWWIDVDGVTKTAARDTSPIATDFQVIHFSGTTGNFVIATEAIHDWMPGRTFTSPTVLTSQTISSSTIVLGNDGKARVELLTNTASANAGDRLVSELRSLIREDFPSLTFLGLYEYSVQASPGGTVDASPTNTTLPLPSISSIRETFPLMSATLTVGDLILVGFVNGDPTRPTVLSAPPSSTAITIGNVSPAAIARVGDFCADVSPGTISGLIFTAPSGGGPCVVTSGAGPTAYRLGISSGSTQVQSG